LNTTSLGQIFIMLQIILFANFVLLFILWVMGKNQEAQLSYLLIPSLLEVCLWPIFKRVLSSRLALINQNSS